MDRGAWRATVTWNLKELDATEATQHATWQHVTLLVKNLFFLLKLLFCGRLQGCHVFLCGLISNGARYVFFLSGGFIWEVVLDVFIAEDSEPMWVHYIPSMVTQSYLVGCSSVR